jgi:hypothetical protein
VSESGVSEYSVSEYGGGPAPRIGEAAYGRCRGAAARANHQARRGLADPTSVSEEAP